MGEEDRRDMPSGAYVNHEGQLVVADLYGSTPSQPIPGGAVPEDATKADLQDILRDQGLPVSGNKDELAERVQEALADVPDDPGVAE